MKTDYCRQVNTLGERLCWWRVTHQVKHSVMTPTWPLAAALLACPSGEQPPVQRLYTVTTLHSLTPPSHS